jgi:hypothetical protein
LPAAVARDTLAAMPIFLHYRVASSCMVALLALAACGGSVAPLDTVNTPPAPTPVATSSAGPTPKPTTLNCDLFFADIQRDPGVQCINAAGRCDLVGTLKDGRSVREACATEPGQGTVCRLFVDGAEACKCPPSRIDWNNTCANAVATCGGWNLVNYAEAPTVIGDNSSPRCPAR